MSQLNFIEKLLGGVEVEWKPLGEFAKIGTGSHDTKDAIDDGDYIFYARGRAPLKLNEFDFDETAIITAGDGVGVGKVFHYAQGKYALHQRAYRIVPSKALDPRFLYHYVVANFYQYIKKTSVHASVTSLRMPMFQKFLIPIPCPGNPQKSLEIQQEIVRILDTFTELTTELTTELSARKKQYNYYRDNLLSFEEGEVEWKTLGQVVNIKNGKDWKSLGLGGIPVYGSGGIMQYVDTFVYDKPTVLIPRKGSITNIFYVETPFWNVDTIYYTEIDTKQILPKFFYYFMKTIDLLALDTGAGRPSLTQAILNAIKVPLPSINEQENIVKTLDKFDTLTSSISEGLPREIKLRQQQYEYYRDLLLSFPKPESELKADA